MGRSSSKAAESSKPMRVFTVNGMSMTSRNAPRIRSMRSGSRSSPPPAHLRYTIGTGQPSFRSIAATGCCCSSRAVRTSGRNVVADHLRDDGAAGRVLRDGGEDMRIKPRLGQDPEVFGEINGRVAVTADQAHEAPVRHILHRREREDGSVALEQKSEVRRGESVLRRIRSQRSESHDGLRMTQVQPGNQPCVLAIDPCREVASRDRPDSTRDKAPFHNKSGGAGDDL